MLNLRLSLLLVLWTLSLPSLIAGDYQKAWEALLNNDRQSARDLFQKALKDPKDGADAALTLLLLDFFDGDPKGSDYWEKALRQLQDPYPYAYALWYKDGVAGDYGFKSKGQLKWLNQLVEDPACPGALKAAAHYQLGHYWITQNKFDDMRREWTQCTNVGQWQFVGPFDNVSDSGFDKNYPPVAQPKPDATFKSSYQTDIQWVNAEQQTEVGWLVPIYHIRYQTAVVYGQSFVTAPADVEAYLGIGFTGNIKVWVNDHLLISEAEQRKTDFDVYRVKCALKKGANRILVQLGYEREDYPNFSIRLTDAAGNLLPGLTSTTTYRPYPADTQSGQPALQPFFAEAFFEKKIQENPDNPLNYYLLCDTYLRSKKTQQALQTVEKMVARAPQSTVFRYLRIQCYRKMENRTSQTEDLQFIRDNDPESLLSLVARYNEEKENEKLEEATALLDRRIRLYGENEETWEEKIQLAAQRKNVEDILKFIETASNKYPESGYFAQLRHELAINMRKDPRAAIAIYEDFLDKYFSVSLAQSLVSDYFDQGMNGKAVRLLETLSGAFPYDPDLVKNLFNFYYGQKENKKAKEAVDKMLRLAPFHAAYWNSAAQLAEQMNDKTEALRCFKKALYYNPNDYNTRRRLRELQQLSDLTSFFPQDNVYDLYKKSRSDSFAGDHDVYYILDDKSTIIYPERNSELYHTLVVKILNEKGIDSWKESSIGFNDNHQRLIIEKAEVLKPSGARISAEQNENQIVFPNLQVGDAVYVKYRLINYTLGRMSREFWDNFGFNAFVPVEKSRYTLLIHKDVPVSFKMVNADYKPETKTVEDFKFYQWESANEPAIKEEKLMPGYSDVSKMLHLSTIPDWGVITTWYADVSAAQAKADYEVRQLMQTLFPAGRSFTETEKARTIYDYIVRNIRYSSVPFRQGAYVPQRAAKVIQTKLGDCKDLATLYAALAREAGLKANLVLLGTRDNGEKDMVLPGVEFNHCIVKVLADGKTYFLELTDSDMPFACLPNGDLQAQALEIPFGSNTATPQLIFINPDTRLRDTRRQVLDVRIEKRDMNITSNGYRQGTATAGLRSTYKSLNRQKRIEEMQNNIAKDFTNPVTVKDLEFGDLEQLKDTAQFRVQYLVKNEVLEIGSLNTFKLPFYFLFLKADAFQEETRDHPVSYWRYEDCDAYTEEITVHLPAGKQFTEIPTDVSLKFNGITYSLRYERKDATTVRAVREINVARASIPAKDYPEFKRFVEDVVAAETKYLAFK